MNFSELKNLDYVYSVVLFLQSSDINDKRAQLEELGNQKNVKLVVQPCPYEGIEFLYRISEDLIAHHTSIDKDVFWQAIRLRKDIPKDIFTEISKIHYDYLCGILQQETKNVAQLSGRLSALSEYFADG